MNKAKLPETLPIIRITKAQKKWLKSEAARTGITLSVIIRSLIQDQVDKK